MTIQITGTKRESVMKKIILIFVFCGIASLCFAGAIAEEVKRNNEKTDLSYALGVFFASDLRDLGLVDLDYTAFMQGFRGVIEDQEGIRFTLDESFDIIDAAITAIMDEKAELGRRQETEFLRINGTRPEVNTTPSGLQYEVLVEGTGRQPQATDYVKVHYSGFFIDGTVFDSSYNRGEPDEFPLRGVIPGWSEGLMLMHEGGRSRLYIPSALAYGAQGAGNLIPPYSLVIFEVEFLEIVDNPTDYYWYDDDLWYDDDYYWYDDDYYWYDD
jgi:FKBP-type peptidyl-prolyl cis-trans isomerase